MHLPQELIDCIIDELGSFEGVLDPERRQALKACSLASSLLLTSSRKYLFAKIRLNEEECIQDDTHESGIRTSSGLGRILEVLVNDSKTSLSDRTPPLASHIRSLSIILSPERAYQYLRIFASFKGRDTYRPPSLPAILRILASSSSITLFSLEFPIFFFYTKWPYLDPQLRAGIESFCRSPSITTLVFQTILELPTTLITACPNLKTLHLYSVSPPDYTAPSIDRAPGNLFPHLESLVLNLHDSKTRTDVLKLFFLSGPNVSSLPKLQDIRISLDRTLGIVNPQELEVLKRAPSLKSITFDIHCFLNGFDHRFPGDLDLSQIPTLRSVTLDILLRDCSHDSTTLSRSFHMFNKVSSPCSINEIDIRMRWRVTHPHYATRIFTSSTSETSNNTTGDWHSFDEAITNTRRFPFLKKLSLRLYMAYGERSSNPTFEHIAAMLSGGIRRCLPAAACASSECFSFVVDIQRIPLEKFCSL